MKKRTMAVISGILAAATVFSMSACKVDIGKTEESGKGTVDPVKPEENEDAEIRLTVGTLGKTDEQSLMQAWINEYQKRNKNVGIKITKNMGGMPEIINWTSAGTLPDIVWTAGDQHSPYSGSGYFQDLSDESVFDGSKAFFDGFYESMIDSTHYSSEDNGIWFVPRDYNRLVIYINVSAFEAAGVEVPGNDWTWDEFISTCNALKKAGAKKAVEWKSWRPVYTTMLTNFGGKYLNDDGSFALDDKAAEACYNFYENFYSAKAESGDPEETALAIKGEGASFKAYAGTITGSIPMVVDVRPQLTGYMQSAYSGDWTLDVRAFPNFTQEGGAAGYVGTGCSGYGITKACTDAKKRAEAWKFLKWCMSEEGYNAVSYLGNIVPAITSMRDSGEWRDYSYGGMSVDADAFVAENTKDIFLNYYNVLPNSKQDSFIRLTDTFWDNVGTGKTFRAACSDFKRDFEDLMK